ncbi:TNT domain-containing protein [Crossiella sp. CA-258035]|uniref:TNT domain-containing protein n=1 Tax=Crossiella sp. CA-258035 TaxID=2981138 RepID=UPI0024BCF2E2|nr:TNT domain-containing protein [Crossiella sp. CA-258035]WHT19959.1 TNT domain-containing protein [Crossiella sp. CA-258035]
MPGRRFLATFLTTLLASITLLLGAASPALAAAPLACAGSYLPNDNRLGPETLPRAAQHPVGRLVTGYKRFGRLDANGFLAKYWDGTANSWKYPPQDGFLLRPDGSPIKQEHRLLPGYELDRFGSEGGQFLAPLGAHYSQRALPPQSLYTFDPAYRCNYHTYRVVKEFRVWQGLIAPWFEQRGRGVQVKLDRALLPGDGYLNVAWLLANGYLVRR